MLSIKTFTDRDARDRAYYELAKTHCDVMRYGDQVAGDPILDDEFQIKGYTPGHMVFCVAYGPTRKPKLAEDVLRADSGIGPELLTAEDVHPIALDADGTVEA